MPTLHAGLAAALHASMMHLERQQRGPSTEGNDGSAAAGTHGIGAYETELHIWKSLVEACAILRQAISSPSLLQ